ncbi:hypothetical protein Rxycam_01789 [Rubrobacter xylanophilus DSM 9941]|nr:hypothetical protein Rxycam_01789 [Rubrobacter xylanophilus DSM 9941]
MGSVRGLIVLIGILGSAVLLAMILIGRFYFGG